jgi:hypothetical protein
MTMPIVLPFSGGWRMTSWQREFLAMGERMNALGPERVGYIPYGTDGVPSFAREREIAKVVRLARWM